MALTGTVWTNGKVSFIRCWVLGLCVLEESGEWVPVEGLDYQDVIMLAELIDFNPGFIYKDEFNPFFVDALIKKECVELKRLDILNSPKKECEEDATFAFGA